MKESDHMNALKNIFILIFFQEIKVENNTKLSKSGRHSQTKLQSEWNISFLALNKIKMYSP